MVRSLWTAPPIRIPAGLVDKKQKGTYIEIPPAVFLAAVGAFGLYVWARRGDKGINPFDWLWARIDAATAEATAKAAGGIVAQEPEAGTPAANAVITELKKRIKQIDDYIANVSTLPDGTSGKDQALAAANTQREAYVTRLTGLGGSYP